MKTNTQNQFNTYRQALSRLVFAEDQAMLYVEGFVVLSRHPFVRRHMSLLETDTKGHSRGYSSCCSICKRAFK